MCLKQFFLPVLTEEMPANILYVYSSYVYSHVEGGGGGMLAFTKIWQCLEIYILFSPLFLESILPIAKDILCSTAYLNTFF